jgi:hypothetical protein
LQHLAVDNSDSLHDPSSHCGKSHGIGGTYIPQLRRRIVEAVAAIDRQMLQRVWQELDICRVTKGWHIGRL